MKKIFLFLTLAFIISCNAQTTISLEQAAIYRKTLDGIPESVTYVKDTGNKIDQFVGTWKGIYGGKQYEIKLEKKLDFGGPDIYWDQLIGRMLIKDTSGNIIFNNFSEIDENISFWGDNFQYSTYAMHFVGNYSCMESGDVFIATMPNNPNEMKLFYSQDSDGILNPAKCPNYQTFIPLLPMEKMTLTKQ